MTTEEKEFTLGGLIEDALDTVVETLLSDEVGLNLSEVQEKLKLSRKGVVSVMLVEHALTRLYDEEGMRGVDLAIKLLLRNRPLAVTDAMLRLLAGTPKPFPEMGRPKPQPKKRPPWA